MMKSIIHRRFKLPVWFLLLLPALALAAIVTATQVAQAVINSPNASAALKQYASTIGDLAINVESSGNTGAYNGSCCYGILQMTETNINDIAHMSASQYRQLDLQSQVNYWAKLTSPLLNSSTVKQLMNMGTFDGRTVNGDLVLACMQLGTGNCKKAINSGSCSGFADRNGTTICSMADKIANDSSSGSGRSGTGSGSSGSTGTPISTVACVRDASGNCKPMDQAMADAFEAAAGFSMSQLRTTIFGIIAAGMLLLSIGIIKDVWRQYAKGAIEQHTVYQVVIRVGVCCSLVLLVMCYT